MSLKSIFNDAIKPQLKEEETKAERDYYQEMLPLIDQYAKVFYDGTR